MTVKIDSLHPVMERGWRSGFGNLLWKENNLRWGGRRWIVPTLIWLAIINGFILLISVASETDPSMAAEDVPLLAMELFIGLGMFASAIGVVVGAQGAIIREKQLGTAAWVLSKPASRSAFIFSKWIAFSLASTVQALAVPAGVFLVQSQLLWGQLPPLQPFLSAWLILVVHMLFYLSLTLMLGTIFSSRGGVAGISLGFMFAGSLLLNVLPSGAAMLFPWSLQQIAGMMGMGQSLPAGWQAPVIATALWIPVFLGIAFWRFGREEF